MLQQNTNGSYPMNNGYAGGQGGYMVDGHIYPMMNMPVMNRGAETEKVKNIIQEVYERQKDAIEFHRSMVDMFDFLHLRGFKTWQECRVKEESDKMQDIQHLFIKRRQTMLGPIKTQHYSTVIPPEMYSHTARDVAHEDISRETKRILKEYLKWEESTLEFYKKKMRELMEIESYAEYIDIRELIDDTSSEIEFLEEFMVELESVGYDSSYIQKVQERFITEFGEKSHTRGYNRKRARLNY